MHRWGLLLRFWVFLLIAVIAGVLVFDFVMSAGAWVGSRLPEMVSTVVEFLWAIAALLVAITLGSAVWNLLYWATGGVSLLVEEQLELPAFGRTSVEDKKPYWATSKAANPGSLREFFNLGEDPEFRIGIVLAGGGAKGVYQAGALRALWEFLEAKDALQYVRMIAGTSIGSWNSMFWMTKQVGGSRWDEGASYKWWTSTRLSSVVNPSIYIPILRNYLAANHVWRRQFRELFADKEIAPQPYFYLTRTNVESATLDFTTNREPPQPPPAPGALPSYRGLANRDHSKDATTSVKQIESAVFASMDIPPAFKRLRDTGGNHYEDGGVIDNLPIQFATWCEGCNLLFVFPLNATFAGRASGISVIQRMARVLDIRQGILERDALKDIGLYNRIIEAEQKKTKLAKGSCAAASPTADSSLRKLGQMHTVPSTTFCICPGPELKVGTFGFWSLKRYGGECFQLMYEATKAELAKFDFSLSNREVWMAKVSPNHEVKYEDFTQR
jgi:predicted acylesterase/phospholipase RssA